TLVRLLKSKCATTRLDLELSFCLSHSQLLGPTHPDRYLKKDKYYFVEANVRHLFDFPTYIVTKLYEEYHEDHLVVENNLNMAGGLFKSPTSSPVHETKQQQQLRAMDRNALLNG